MDSRELSYSFVDKKLNEEYLATLEELIRRVVREEIRRNPYRQTPPTPLQDSPPGVSWGPYPYSPPDRKET